jgi:hypothetical protein
MNVIHLKWTRGESGKRRKKSSGTGCHLQPDNLRRVGILRGSAGIWPLTVISILLKTMEGINGEEKL